MMLGLVQLLVGFVVAWEAVELVLRHGLLLSVFKLGIFAALAAAAGCVGVMYVSSSPFRVALTERNRSSLHAGVHWRTIV
jgi:hypothetical protein